MTEDLRYPIGKFEWVPPENEAQMAKRREHYIDVLTKLPDTFSKAVSDLLPAQLDTPYRPEGWTVRQLAHHVPDSHANAFIRFKLALTEYEPTIKTCGPSCLTWPIPQSKCHFSFSVRCTPGG